LTPEDQNKIKAKSFLKQAKENLGAVNELIALGYYGIAISRAYYAAFYSASAILTTEGLEFSKHSSLISAIGRDFIGKYGISKQHHHELTFLFKARQESDYEVLEEPTPAMAKKSRDCAAKWVAIAEEIITKRNQNIT